MEAPVAPHLVELPAGRRRARQGRITAHPLQAPGFVILDSDCTVRFLYRGRTLGDYPPITAIVAAATGLGRAAE